MQGRKSSIDRLWFGATECDYKVQVKWWDSATCMVQQAVKRPVMARPLQWVCWKAACVSSRGFPSIGLSDGLWLPAICTDCWLVGRLVGWLVTCFILHPNRLKSGLQQHPPNIAPVMTWGLRWLEDYFPLLNHSTGLRWGHGSTLVFGFRGWP
jgi:hypothetical protein